MVAVPSPPIELRKLSNEALKRELKGLAITFSQIAARDSQDFQDISEVDRYSFTQKRRAEFAGIHMSHAAFLASEAVNRIGPMQFPTDDPTIGLGAGHLVRGTLIGAFPIEHMSHFLNYLAERIPHEDKKTESE